MAQLKIWSNAMAFRYSECDLYKKIFSNAQHELKWTMSCLVFSHCGWSTSLTFAADVLKRFNMRSDFSGWFVKGICVHAGWSRCFMADTNTCRSLRCGQQTCDSPYLHVFSAWEKDKLQHISKEKHGKQSLMQHAKLHLHCMAQHTQTNTTPQDS